LNAGTRALHAWRRIVPERTRLMIPAFLRRAGRDLLSGPVNAMDPNQAWSRVVMNRDIDRLIRQLPPERFDAIEISGELRGGYPWRSYTNKAHPDFDLCAAAVPRERMTS
jgi:hypothetical protein